MFSSTSSPIPNVDRLVLFPHVASGVRALVRLVADEPCTDEMLFEPFDGPVALAPPADFTDSDVTAEVTRGFVFVDLCGFTSYTDESGVPAALDTLTAFRSQLRVLAARRGVRVAKWLGDGALVVGVHEANLVAFALDIVHRGAGDLDLRAGVAAGPVLMFDGDDYVGRHVNLASRLCDNANPGEVLADPSVLDHLPDWAEITHHRKVHPKGTGPVEAAILRIHSSARATQKQ